MNNLDKIKDVELRAQIAEALKGENEDAIAEAMVRMAQGIQNDIIKEARSLMNNEINDREILRQRGIATLTTEERDYYKKVIEKRGFTGMEDTMPKSIYDRVFEYLETEHPLLSEIDFQNTSAVQEWIRRKSDCVGAFWGKLTEPIRKELENGFEKESTEMYKLSAYMPVAKSMLDLGPEWLDKFVRTVLSESISIALELAIVAGTGKDQPIGMIKNLKGAVVEGVYPDKEAITLTDLTATTLGTEIMAPLTKGGKRTVSNVLILVNPLDYWAKIFGATTMLTANGSYIYGVLPISGKFVQSVAVPTGKMVAGLAKDYFMGVGSNGKIEHSDEYKFLEDERVYINKMYANGQPVDNDSFLVFDIQNLVATTALNVNISKDAAGAAVKKK